MHTLSNEEQKQKENAIAWARNKANRRDVIAKYLDIEKYPSTENPVVMFMAGSPGAGKTEFTKSFIPLLDSEGQVNHIRLDPDDLREEFEDYNGKNSVVFQQPVSILVDSLISAICKNNQSAIIDGTLAKYDTAVKNIQKVIELNGEAAVIYVYQDPLVAWKFTQEREVLEGRRIEKNDFIRALFSSKDNVNKLKDQFGSKLKVIFVEKDYSLQSGRQIKSLKINVDNLDKYVKIPYTSEELEDKL